MQYNGGMSAPETPPVKKPSHRVWLHGLWKGLNSAVFIASISGIAVALLTQWFAEQQAESEDMAARRTELSRDLVELELRTARLQVIQLQAADKTALTTDVRTRLGERAKAIVAGDARTVTSDPTYKDIHLLTLLGRAETAAGVKLSDKNYLPDFTDRDGADAVARTSYVLCRSYRLVLYLKGHFESGDFPLQVADADGRQYYSTVYAQLDSLSSCAKFLEPDDGRD